MQNGLEGGKSLLLESIFVTIDSDVVEFPILLLL